MKRAQAFPPLARSLAFERRVLFDDLNDIELTLELLGKVHVFAQDYDIQFLGGVVLKVSSFAELASRAKLA